MEAGHEIGTPKYSIIIGPYASLEYPTLRLISDPYALLGIVFGVHPLRLIEYRKMIYCREPELRDPFLR